MQNIVCIKKNIYIFFLNCLVPNPDDIRAWQKYISNIQVQSYIKLALAVSYVTWVKYLRLLMPNKCNKVKLYTDKL